MRSGVSVQVRPWVNSIFRRFPFDIRVEWPDLVLSFILASSIFIITLLNYDRISLYINHFSTWDFWFESDPPRTVLEASDRRSPHHHATSHHPLLSLIIYPPVFFLRKAIGLSTETAIGYLMASISALVILMSYATMRILRLARSDAFVFTCLLGASASGVFWFPVPETFGLGGLSILIVMLVCAISEQRGGLPTWVYFFASATAFSVTFTNWLAALPMLYLFLDRWTAFGVATKSVLFVMAMYTLQQALFPFSVSFFTILLARRTEVEYLFNEEALGLIPKLFAFFFHSMVMPAIRMAYGMRLSVQSALPGEGSVLSLAAAIGWGALLSLGCWSAIRLVRVNRWVRGSKTGIVLLVAIAGQVLITITFGIESFLYSLHFAPLLVMLAALSALTPARRVAVALAAALVVMAGFNNFPKFASAAERLADRYEHERQYAALLAERVEPDAIIVCGTKALAATGEARMPRPSPSEAPIKPMINFAGDPDSCSFPFGDGFVNRQGWMLWLEDWSIEAIDTFAKRGARYFATSSEYGLEKRKELFDQLDRRFHAVTRTPEWAIYDLQRPPGP